MLDTGIAPSPIEVAPLPPTWVRSLVTPSSGTSEMPVPGSDRPGVVETASGNDVCLVSVALPQARSLSAADLRLAVNEMFMTVVRMLQATECPHAVRMWSFIPGIHDSMGDDLDRYRVFNTGRFDAFSAWFGGADAFARSLPAASAVGHSGDTLHIHALGSRFLGNPIENPRQLAAYRYSRAYGPRPPCFVRATIAQLPIGQRLLVAGTASILGERSVHPGCLPTQFNETLENIRTLVLSARSEHRFNLAGVETARAYYPRGCDLDWLSERLSSELPASAHVEYIQADICRRELLVEVELTIAPSLY